MALNDRDDLPQRRKRKKSPPSKPAIGVWLVVGGLLVVVLIAAGTTVGILWARGDFRRPAATGAGITPKADKPADRPDLVPNKADRPHDRLVGQWEYLAPEGRRGKMILDVRKGGTLQITGFTQTGSVVVDATWEVRDEKPGRVTIRLNYSDRPPAEWGVDLLSDNEIRVNFLTSDSSPVIYKRKQ